MDEERTNQLVPNISYSWTEYSPTRFLWKLNRV